MNIKSIKGIFSSSAVSVFLCALGLGILLLFLGTGSDTAVTASAVPSGAEEEIAALCSSLEGVGECYVFVTYEEKSLGYGRGTEKTVLGIAVVCSGGDSDAVKQRVSRVLSSVYGIGTNRIRVEKLAKK